MIFPFEVTFKKKLSGEIEKFTTPDILDFYKKEFEKSGADSIKFINGSIIVKNNLIDLMVKPGLNWNRWVGVYSAKFQITEKENKVRIAVYSLNVSKILIFGAIVGLFVGLSSNSIWNGLGIFGFLGILTWAIKLFQHRIDFDDFIYKHKHNLIKNNLDD
jgi:hypothetical protein